MLERGRSISPSLPPFSATLPHLSRSSFFFFFVPFSPPPLPPSVHSFLVFSFIPLDTWYIRVYVPSPSSFLSLPTLASSHSFVQCPFHTLSLTFCTTLFDRVISRYYSPVFGYPRRCIERFRVHWPRYSATVSYEFLAETRDFPPCFRNSPRETSIKTFSPRVERSNRRKITSSAGKIEKGIIIPGRCPNGERKKKL